MKRLIAVVLAVVFGVSLLSVSVMLEAKRNLVWAEEAGLEESEIAVGTAEGEEGERSDEQRVREGEEGAVDYYLPYPGILPDHPFYWLKMVRDRVALWLTRGSTARIEKLLLYADKRIGAANALSEGNKQELAVATATKAEKYLEQVVGEAEKLKQAGENTDNLAEKINNAHLKHIEILTEILFRAPEQARGGLETALEMSRRGHARVIVVMGRKADEELEEEVSEDEEVKEELEGENEKGEGADNENPGRSGSGKDNPGQGRL